MRGHSLSASALGRSLLTLSLLVLWEGILGPASRRGHGERFGRSRGALRPLKGNRKFGNHILICSPQELQLGRAPEQRKSAGSSFTCLFVHSFVHSLIHLFNQCRGRPSPALGSPPAWVRPCFLSWSSMSEGETDKKSASTWCPCCGRWKG